MKADGKQSKITDRIVELKLVAERAGDEFLLSEIYRVLREGHQGSIIVTHAQDNPRKVFKWTAELTDQN